MPHPAGMGNPLPGALPGSSRGPGRRRQGTSAYSFSGSISLFPRKRLCTDPWICAEPPLPLKASSASRRYRRRTAPSRSPMVISLPRFSGISAPPRGGAAVRLGTSQLLHVPSRMAQASSGVYPMRSFRGRMHSASPYPSSRDGAPRGGGQVSSVRAAAADFSHQKLFFLILTQVVLKCKDFRANLSEYHGN